MKPYSFILWIESVANSECFARATAIWQEKGYCVEGPLLMKLSLFMDSFFLFLVSCASVYDL